MNGPERFPVDFLERGDVVFVWLRDDRATRARFVRLEGDRSIVVELDQRGRWSAPRTIARAAYRGHAEGK